MTCTAAASCEEGDHTYSWPCDLAQTDDDRGIASVRAEFIRALEYWRWCWDCGTTDRDCRALGRPCCPDCRHRDMGNLALIAAIFGKG
jgi:hypothetical protein